MKTIKINNPNVFAAVHGVYAQPGIDLLTYLAAGFFINNDMMNADEAFRLAKIFLERRDIFLKELNEN